MQNDNSVSLKGRGISTNPPNRFEKVSREKFVDSEREEDEESPSRTQFLPDSSRSIISFNSSPDIPFEASINCYRGCEHGCSYCYARPTHEYLGFSSGLDFETKIMVKEKAPELLRAALSKKGWRPTILAMSGVTDPYQPIEKRVELTRRCLEILLEFKNPVSIITKNSRVVRDRDILTQMAREKLVVVYISITTLDRNLCSILEPRTSRPEKRLEAISLLNKAGIPVGVMVAPVIPGLNDFEIPRIIQESKRAGARFAGKVLLRLPQSVAPLFEEWLKVHFFDRSEKILNRLRALRGGNLNDPNFGSRMKGQGVFADQIDGLFESACKKAGMNLEDIPITLENFQRPSHGQLSLFK
ncbi:MAG: PA0069 family radical SAM protein [Nitrospiria bacterium]